MRVGVGDGEGLGDGDRDGERVVGGVAGIGVVAAINPHDPWIGSGS